MTESDLSNRPDWATAVRWENGWTDCVAVLVEATNLDEMPQTTWMWLRDPAYGDPANCRCDSHREFAQ